MWDLNLVLHALMGKPFEPLVTCSLLHLSMKVAFLLAIMSARSVGGLGVLMAHPPYIVFLKDQVILQPHPKFIPKVASPFHLNQPVYLSVFFHELHADSREAPLHILDDCRALAFYIEKTKTFKKIIQTVPIYNRTFSGSKDLQAESIEMDVYMYPVMLPKL